MLRALLECGGEATRPSLTLDALRQYLKKAARNKTFAIIIDEGTRR